MAGKSRRKAVRTRQNTFFCGGCALSFNCRRCFNSCAPNDFSCRRRCRCNSGCFDQCRFSSDLVGCLRSCCQRCSNTGPIFPIRRKKR